MKFLSAAAALLFAAAAHAGDVEMAGMKSAAPKGWKEEPPASSMRLTQFKLPKADGDKEDAEVIIFTFPGGSGSAEQNLERQVKKFKPAEGKDKVEVKVEKIQIGKQECVYQDVQGVYLSKFPPFAPDAKVTEKPSYRQLYVILITDKGDFYPTLIGPAKTVEKHKADFDGFLKNFK